MNYSGSLIYLSCGGTIEKVYLPAAGLLAFDQSRLDEWLTNARIGLPWQTEALMLMDSLEMTDQHRAILADRVSHLDTDRVVIIHGTDTMVESAQAVMLRRKKNQVVVFTGAMLPECIKGSEAFFNLGLATAAVQTCRPGVYIAMSGQVFEADQVRKNRERSIFEAVPKGG